MNFYVNDTTNTLTIDFGTKHVTIDLPPSLPKEDIAQAMQSETVRAIIRQLEGGPHGK